MRLYPTRQPKTWLGSTMLVVTSSIFLHCKNCYFKYPKLLTVVIGDDIVEVFKFCRVSNQITKNKPTGFGGTIKSCDVFDVEATIHLGLFFNRQSNINSTISNVVNKNSDFKNYCLKNIIVGRLWE